MRLKKDRAVLGKESTMKKYDTNVMLAFYDIRILRMTRKGNLQEIVKRLKDQVIPKESPFGPLMYYLMNNLQMDGVVLADIRFLLSADNSFLDDLMPYIEVYANNCIKFGSMESYIFLTNDCKYELNLVNTLSLAVVGNNLPLVSYLISQKEVDINEQDSFGNNPLIIAVEKDFYDIAGYLVNAGANLFFLKNYETVFSISIKAGNLQMLQLLLAELPKQSMNVSDVLDSDGYGLVYKAIDYQQLEILHYLITIVGEDCKDPNGHDLIAYSCTQNHFEIAEHLATKYGYSSSFSKLYPGDNTLLHLCGQEILTFASFKSLLDLNTLNVRQKNTDGNTFLHLAARYSNYIAIKYYLHLLLKNKVPDILNLVNKDGKNCGHILLEENNISTFLEVIKSTGISLLEKDKFGQSLLEKIALHPESEKLLGVAILKLQASNKQKRKRVIEFMHQPNLLGIFIDFFIQEQVGVVKNDDYAKEYIGEWVYSGQTPLHLAVKHLEYSSIQEIISKHNLVVNVRNKEKQTPLYFMLINNKLNNALQFIKDYAPDLLDIDGKGSSLLHVACELELEEVIDFCLRETNLSPLQINSKHQNSISILLANNNQKLLKIILDNMENIRVDILNSLIDFVIKNLSVDILSEELLAGIISEYIPEILHLTIEDTYNSAITENVSELLSDMIDNVESKQTYTEDYTAKSLTEAVIARDYNYFRDLPKDNPNINSLIIDCAVDLLLQAVFSGDQQLTLFLLSIPCIQKQAHLQDNVVFENARIKSQRQVVECLLKLTDVQKALLPKGKKIKSISNLTPKCYTNPKNRIVIDTLSKIINTDKYRDLNLYLTGSSMIKYAPNDLDFVSPNSQDILQSHLAFELLSDLIAMGARVSVIDKNQIFGYLSPKTKPERRVIPFEWLNCKLEFVLTAQSIQQYAFSALTTVTSALFCMHRLHMLEVEGIGSIQDIQNKVISTVSNPALSLTIDFSRVLKLVNMQASCPEGFCFSRDLSRAIIELFNTRENPFFTNNLNISNLHHHLAAMFSVECSTKYIEILYCHKILLHLINYLEAQKDEVSPYYLEALKGGWQALNQRVHGSHAQMGHQYPAQFHQQQSIYVEPPNQLESQHYIHNGLYNPLLFSQASFVGIAQHDEHAKTRQFDKL